MSSIGQCIWIDLDNSPHVPFFLPILKELERRGYRLLLTARKAFQVEELVRLHGLSCRIVGTHSGKNRVRKVLGLVVRSAQLLPIAARERPSVAVSHGSRAQLMTARLLGIKSIALVDYEHVNLVVRPDWVFVPEVVSSADASRLGHNFYKYPGIKEDVYVVSREPSRSVLEELGLDSRNDIVVTIRPPATEAHYHSPNSEKLFTAIMDWLLKVHVTRLVVLPRTEAQKNEILRHWGGYAQAGRLVIPERAVDGLGLIASSDLVVSGGGTMNREAAALGVPVYSIFRGERGAVDQYLEETGRLVMLDDPNQFEQQVHLRKRSLSTESELQSRYARDAIVAGIVSVAAGNCPAPWIGT